MPHRHVDSTAEPGLISAGGDHRKLSFDTVKPDKRSFRKLHVVASNPSWLPLIGRYIVGAEEHNTWRKVRSLRNQALLYSQPFLTLKPRPMLEIDKADASEILATINENPHMEVQLLILGMMF